MLQRRRGQVRVYPYSYYCCCCSLLLLLLQIILFLLVPSSSCVKGFVPSFISFHHQHRQQHHVLKNYKHVHDDNVEKEEEQDTSNYIISPNYDVDVDVDADHKYHPSGADQGICTRRSMMAQSTATTATAFVLLFATGKTGPSHAASAAATAVVPSQLPAIQVQVQVPRKNTTIRDENQQQQQQLELEPIDVSKVIQENAINITLTNKQNQSQAFINRTSYEKIIQPEQQQQQQRQQRPSLIPSKIIFFQKKQSVANIIEPIPDTKLLFASAVAGSVTEIIRSVVLYPLTTIKTRVQYKTPSISSFQKYFQRLQKVKKNDEMTIELLKGDIDIDIDTIARKNKNEDGIEMKKKDVEMQEKIDRNNTISKPAKDDDDDCSSKNRDANGPINTNINLKKLTNLYAGFVPFLIASVPAAGIYFGIRDVSKRELITLNDATSNTIFTSISTSISTSTPQFQFQFQFDDLSLTLLSVLLADICCLAVKTPALAFSVRRQVATIDEQFAETVNTTVTDTDTDTAPIINETNYFIRQQDPCSSSSRSISSNTQSSLLLPWWEDIFKDSWKQLSIVVLTDIPYLFIKISLLRVLATGNQSIAEYTLLNALISCFSAAITTPFDVARTRILVDSNGDPTDGLDGGLIAKNNNNGYSQSGSLKYIYETLKMIAKEGSSDQGGDYSALFAGWYERVLYLGISIAWFDSIRTIGYLAIRDILLLT